MDERPVPLPVDPSRIPEPLASRDQWVAWKYVWNKKREKWDKPPINPRTGRFAEPDDPSTCGTLQEALARMMRDQLDGIGFLFTEDDPFVGIDLDGAIVNGGIAPWAQEILDSIVTFAELSVSGTGVHLILEYSRPFGKGIRGPSIEVYGNLRFFVVTGHTLPNRTVITECTERFETWFETFQAGSKQALANGVSVSKTVAPLSGLTESDCRLLDTCRAMDSKFSRLFDTGALADYNNDHSRADLGLLGYLVKAGAHTPEDLDRLYRHSALMREKWERKDYRNGTIAKALDGTVIAGISTLDTEATLRREIEAQRRQYRELSELHRRNAEMLEWIAQIMRNPQLKLAAPVACALLRDFASFESRQAMKPYPISIGQVAEEAGLQRNTASRHIDRLEAVGLVWTKKVTEPGYTDVGTGELVLPKTRTYMAPIGTSKEFAAGVAAFDGKTGWGGARSAKDGSTPKSKRAFLTVLGDGHREPGQHLSVIGPAAEAQPA